MRKAINFDIDTKKYESYTGQKAPLAYAQIRRFLKKYEFKHRQGSGYVSNGNISTIDIGILVADMSMKFDWLNHCIKEIDATNIGKQYSLVDAINKASINKKSSELDDIEI